MGLSTAKPRATRCSSTTASARRASSSPAAGSTPRRSSTPPYYVIEVIPAITFTFTGLRIDEHARVLDADGEPIRGLLAAGADAGGVFHRAYAGGLAAALVFGLQAAATATQARLAL